MIPVQTNAFGKYVEATLNLSVRSYLPADDIRDEIPEEEASDRIQIRLEDYADSNDGAELLANANFELVK